MMSQAIPKSYHLSLDPKMREEKNKAKLQSRKL